MGGILAYTTFFAAGLLSLGGVRVPYTLIQPENSVTEQTAGSFQLAGAAYGIQKMGAKAYGLWTSPRGLLEGDHAPLTITGSDGDANYSSPTENVGFGPFKPQLNADGQTPTISAIIWPTVVGTAIVLALGFLLKIGHWVYLLVTDLEKEFKHWRWTVKNATLDNYARQRKIQETLDKLGRQLNNTYVLTSVLGMGMQQVQENIDLIKGDWTHRLGRLQYSANLAEDELKYIHEAVDTLKDPAAGQDSQPVEPLAPRPEMVEEPTNDLVVASEDLIPGLQASSEDSVSEQTEQPESATEEPATADQSSPSSSEAVSEEGTYSTSGSSLSSPPTQSEEANVEDHDHQDAPRTTDDQTEQHATAAGDQSSPSSSEAVSEEGTHSSPGSSLSSPPSQSEEANVEDREQQDAPRSPEDQPQESLD